jgi:hypothetical protein
MKKLVLATTMATLVSGSAMATNIGGIAADAGSLAAVSTSTGAFSTGNGLSIQESAASATNASYAGAHNLGTESTGHLTLNKTNWSKSAGEVTEGAVYTGSAGLTTSMVSGTNVGSATGSSEASALQAGSGDASVKLSNNFGSGKLESESLVGSASFSKNTDNGFASNFTEVEANNITTGSVGGSIYKAGKSFLGFPVTTTSIVNTSTATVDTAGYTGSLSEEVAVGAYSLTGGFALQTGKGIAIAP